MSDITQRLASLSPEKRALLMAQLNKQAPAKPKQEIARRPRPERLPVSFAQQRLWILDQLEANSAAYNVPLGMWIYGQPNIAVLSRAVSEIVARHEALRTVVLSDDAGPFQSILPASEVKIEHHLIAAQALPDGRAEVIRLARAAAARPFAIATGPMLRVNLFSVNEQEHLLFLNAHHIAIDGWSYGVLLNELTALYTAYLQNQTSPLPELPIQYVDYTLWQRELLAEGAPALEKQLGYWQQHLSGQLPVLELPGDHLRPAVQSNRGANLCHVLPVASYNNLKNLSRAESVTHFMVFAAAFLSMLSRWSGQTDIVLGVGVANRNRLELEPLVGFFVNTLPMRNDLSGNPSFRELLGRVKGVTLGAYEHQDLPVERLLEDLNIERALSHSALFQAMLFFQNFPTQEIDLPGVRMAAVEPGAIDSGTARTDLSFFVGEANGSLQMYIEYATDIFEKATIQAFARQLVQFIDSVAANPQQKIGEVDLLPAEERQQLLYHFNATERELPATTVHAMFEAQAAKTPQAIALRFGTQSLTYSQLNAQASSLAHALKARGMQAGELAGIFVQRSPAMLVAMLGILKTGAAYVPLDPAFPAERIGFMLEDAAMRVVVSERNMSGMLPASSTQTLLLEDVPQQESLFSCVVASDSTAYVIFTSGSTGRPKGVLLPHRAVVNFLLAMARQPGMSANDSVCAVTTLSFDIAVLELLLPLSVGASVTIADSNTVGDGIALARLLRESRATMMQATPASWRMLLDAGWQSHAGLKMLSGGEALSRELAERLLAGGGELWNMYGPTETTVWSAVEQVLPGASAIGVGQPIANTQVYVVDANLHITPIGVPGELLIGGAGVANGYLGRAELSREKFIADPFSKQVGAHLYRTGDLARWTRAGRLEILGRMDHQIKLRGYRIELGEIEAVLLEHPQVKQATVICREDRPGDQRLVAYLIAEDTADSAPLDQNALKNLLKSRLPEYMLPSAYLQLDKFPLTPNGKLNRRALPAPDMQAASQAQVAPRNAEEVALCEIWADILGLASVGIEDDFFQLGGHSLSATQLIVRVNKTFDSALTLRTLFEAPSVAAFAEHLMQARIAHLDNDALHAMLNQLDGLSEAEIEAMLAEGSPS